MLSVPCNWGTHSYCAKTRVVIRNYAQGAEQPDPWGPTPSHRTNGPGPASRSGTGPVSPRVPEVEMLSTFGRGPGPPQVGPGPPRAYPDTRELSAQLAAREGSGAAACHEDAGAGTSLPLEAPSPTRIKCEWLRRALLPLGTGQLLSVHTVDRQLPRRLVSYQGKH